MNANQCEVHLIIGGGGDGGKEDGGSQTSTGGSRDGKDGHESEKRPSRILPESSIIDLTTFIPAPYPCAPQTSTDCSGASIPVAEIPAGCATAMREALNFGEGRQDRSGGCGPSSR